MGAGCNYRNDIDGTKSYWIKIDNQLTENEEDIYLEDFDHCLNFDLFMENLVSIFDIEFRKDKTWDIYTPKYNGNNRYTIESSCFIIELESSYYGDSIVFNMKENTNAMEYINWNNSGQYNLLISNAHKSYGKIMRGFNKYFKLNVATSAWTSTQLDLKTI